MWASSYLFPSRWHPCLPCPRQINCLPERKPGPAFIDTWRPRGGGGADVHKTGSRGYVYKFTRFCYSYVLRLLCMEVPRCKDGIFKLVIVRSPGIDSMSCRLAFYDQKILDVLCPISTLYTVCLPREKNKGDKFCNVAPYRRKSTRFSQ